MNEVPAKGTPMLAGWVIAFALAAVATGVSMVMFGFSFTQASFVAAVLFIVVGVILGLPGRPLADVDRPAAQAGLIRVPDHTVAAMHDPAPVAVPPSAPSMASPAMAMRPQGLPAARNGRPDNLQVINGIGPKLEVLCHRLGFFHFDQIAAWTPAEIAWVDDNLEGFKGRVTRDDWVAQARVLAAGGTLPA